MLKAIMSALCAHDNGVLARDIMYHVRGYLGRRVKLEDVVQQLNLLCERGVLMRHGERYMFIDTIQ